MDFKQIQELIKLVSKSNISEISIEEENFKITIKQKDHSGEGAPLVQPAYAMVPPVAAMPPSSLPPASPAPQPATQPAPAAAAAPREENYITIKSPMIGTFYRSPSPDKPPFVNVGDEVKPGQVVCIIEAMKLFNEIESEVSGRIVKVLVEDASPVEFDQPLFLVEPV
ncbi:MAG: acetyl-CoA carboxylase biotin carboxyl carrier protein [Thermoflavifilum sp.]|jgi:acetyl-CoA carboxylase biotin carboxyl carrier protein|uniref:acetyl-CoA carboxylase biotin carboxyl carrier protein n=1 Tax=Thermoflavifilum sp. TaxID=1968839 RepID=UPI0018A4CD74|nr:acetyl-CoA carboxylase biotin carboxyl carrier protein [Thermoflavifilum sp.]QOR75867.1 MAG: acetyl-CoA carboxylase biotin carboxyl carrier protein [Thermoflavifilum sp.]